MGTDVANQLPPSLVVLDGELRPLATLALDGQPSGVYALPGEGRFEVVKEIGLRGAGYL